MALPSSGALSFGALASEMGISATNRSLSAYSQYAANSSGYVPPGLTSSPYAVGEFFGFTFYSVSFTAINYRVGDPCGYNQTFYMGSDGKLYETASTSTPVDGQFLYSYSYFDYETWQYVWDMYYVNGGNMSYYGTNYSGCGNF